MRNGWNANGLYRDEYVRTRCQVFMQVGNRKRTAPVNTSGKGATEERN